MPQDEQLVALYRNGQIESTHCGSIAVVDFRGHVLASVGNPYQKIYMRSCAKPFQALPVVSTGALDRFAFSAHELAIMAGSHSGEERHIAAVQSILSKIGLTENALLCGAHAPNPTSSLHNNCSGKHAGMLAVAVDQGWSTSDYLDVDHPVQKMIREGLIDFLDMNEKEVILAVDGCSAPTFYVPLHKMAQAFARLADSPNEKTSARPPQPTASSVVGSGRTWSRSDALKWVASAMMKEPYFVAGTKRLDTEVMNAFPGTLVMKGGAEGVQGAGIVRLVGHDGPVGVAFKIADGNARRAGGLVLLHVLRQLRFIEGEVPASLQKYLDPVEKNHRGIDVGQVKAEFRLSFIDSD